MFGCTRALLPVLAVVLFLAGVQPFAAAQTQATGASGFNVVVSLSVKDVMDKVAANPEWNKNLQAAIAQGGPEKQAALNMLKEKGGFDLFKDIDSLIIGLDISELGKKMPVFVLIINGRFDAAKLIPILTDMLKPQGTAVTKLADHNGIAVYSIKKEQSSDGALLAFVGQSLLISDNEAALHKTIDSVKSGTSMLAGDATMAALAGQTNQNATFWAFGQIPDILTKAKAGAPAGGANPGGGGAPGGGPMAGFGPDSIKAFAASIDAKQGLDLNVKLACKDAATALNLKNMFDMGRGWAGMQLSQPDSGLSKDSAATINQALQKATCNAANSVATLALKLTPEEYAALEKIGQEMAKAAEAKAALNAGPNVAPNAAPGGGGGMGLGALGGLGDLMGSLGALGGGAPQGAPAAPKAAPAPGGAPTRKGLN
ncbi:MAG: DUF3352 domain-containing protein [Candidatus Sumerlaeota bacterium]|nr:DUF3352 domain-containing protein [Candidatus Sumerlaeota bacterium]